MHSAAAAAALACIALELTAGASPFVRVDAHRLSMGCAYSTVAYGASPDAIRNALERALDEVDRIDRLMSNYRTGSALSAVNREAAERPVAVDSELFEILATAQSYSEQSAGAFDVTVGPLMRAWGFFQGEGRVPSDQELAAARARVGFRHVVLDRDRRTVRFDRPGVEVDLGAIAKGYAVDRAVDVLRRQHVSAALVSACGSSIYAIGAPPDRQAWDVEVQDPVRSGAAALKVPLRDRALSVSGRSERSFERDGVTYSHIMDPRTGRPMQGILSVAVVTPHATDGDALATALFVQGPDRGRRLLEAARGAEAYFFVPRGTHSWRLSHLRAADAVRGAAPSSDH